MYLKKNPSLYGLLPLSRWSAFHHQATRPCNETQLGLCTCVRNMCRPFIWAVPGLIWLHLVQNKCKTQHFISRSWYLYFFSTRGLWWHVAGAQPKQTPPYGQPTDAVRLRSHRHWRRLRRSSMCQGEKSGQGLKQRLSHFQVFFLNFQNTNLNVLGLEMICTKKCTKKTYFRNGSNFFLASRNDACINYFLLSEPAASPWSYHVTSYI